MFRRETFMIGLVSMALLTLGCSGSSPAPGNDAGFDAGFDGGSKVCAPMHVEVPTFPDPESIFVEPAQEYLDQLATQYVCGLPDGAVPNDSTFMYGYAPVAAFNKIISGDVSDLNKKRWVMYVSGYFGGVWLTSNLNKETPDGGVTMLKSSSLIDADKIARDAMAAAEGPDKDLFNYNKSILIAPFLFPDLAMASNFGYNEGYLLEIYEKPPPGCTPPAGYINCTKLMWCEYADKRVPALSSLADAATKLNEPVGRWRILRNGDRTEEGNGVEAAETNSVALGRAVWGGVMKKDSITPDFYISLLDVSASFLEVVQAAGLFSAKGYAEQDAASGKTAAILQSGIGFWLASYMSAFSHGEPLPEPVLLPKIVPVEK